MEHLKHDLEKDKCSVCGGTGEVIEDVNKNPEYPLHDWKPCPGCQYKGGKIPDKETVKKATQKAIEVVVSKRRDPVTWRLATK